MKATDSFDPATVFEEAAAGWIVEREEGFAPVRAEAFAEWCGSDSRHAEAVARVERSLALLDEMPAIRAPLVARIGRVAEKKAEVISIFPGVRSNPWLWAAGLAAALVLGAASWWFVSLRTSPVETYAAEAGGPRRVALSDGSVVDLNTDSRLQVQFSAGERLVTLAAGEAHFQVAHNAARPFVVTANGVSVRAVGTAFNVRLVDDTVDVLVTEGTVEIDRHATSTFSSRTAPIIPLLSAGERTQISRVIAHAPPVEEVAPAAMHALLSWQDRMTSFADVPLREMVVRLNRCNSTQLVLGDTELGDRKIGGVIDLNQVNAFVHLLEQDGDIIAERRSDGEIVLRRLR